MLKHPSIPQTQYYTCIVAVILSLSEVILLYSYCANKGLIYITIAALFNCQPSFYFKYISINKYLFYNIYLVFNAKCIYTCLLSL